MENILNIIFTYIGIPLALILAVFITALLFVWAYFWGKSILESNDRYNRKVQFQLGTVFVGYIVVMVLLQHYHLLGV